VGLPEKSPKKAPTSYQGASISVAVMVSALPDASWLSLPPNSSSLWELIFVLDRSGSMSGLKVVHCAGGRLFDWC
jgi:hypothetical protein